MEVNGETERREQVEEEEQVHYYYYYFYYSILNSICSAFNKALETILKCLGLDSPTEEEEEEEVEVVVEVEEEEDLIETETVEETGLMKKVTGFLRRRPRPPFSSGRPGQIN
ncbi:unnamed protein product [Cochlearia groenlandica]